MSARSRPKPAPSRIKKAWRWSQTPPTNLAALAVLALLLIVVTIQLIAKDGVADLTTLALSVLASILVFALLAPRQTGRAITRITSFKVAGVELGLQTVTSAERVEPPGVEGDGFVVNREDRGYGEIVEEIRRKLRFVWNITGLRNEVADNRAYHEIAWRLRAEGLLDDAELNVIMDLISERDYALSGLPSEAQDDFLDAAWAFATRFGSMVWDRYVRRELKRTGWLVLDFAQAPGHRPDFLAHWNGKWVLVAPRVGGSKKVSHFPSTRKRLVRYVFSLPIAGRCIAIPPQRKATVLNKTGAGRDDPVKVLELQTSLLGFPIRAFDTSPCNDDVARERDA